MKTTDDRKIVRVTAVDYETREKNGTEYPLVQLTGRDVAGERFTTFVSGTEPYMYMPVDEVVPDEFREHVVRQEEGYESYDGKPLTKVVTQIPKHVEKIASEVDDDHEADIPYYRRISIDYGLSGYIKVPDEPQCHIGDIQTDVDISTVKTIEPRIFLADIEVVSRGPGSFNQMMQDFDQQITHITVWDSQSDEYICLFLDPDNEVSGGDVKTELESAAVNNQIVEELEKDIILRRYESEKALLRGFITLFENRRPDLVSGWNFIDFDWEYLLGRMKRLDEQSHDKDPGVNVHKLSDIGYCNGYQVEREADCVPAFDLMDGYKKMTVPVQGEMRSYSLDYVAKNEIGIGKIPNINVAQTYDNDRSLLTAYNIMDVVLTVVIDREQAVHEFFYELAELSQVQIYDTFSEMRLIDGYIMSRSSDQEILPSATEKDLDSNAGGLVLNPSDGVDDWVGVVDLKSLYPSCIITWNLSPETIHWYSDRKPDHDNYINIPWLPDADHADGGDFGLSEIQFDVMWADLSNEGLIPRYVKKLFPEREEMKQLRDDNEPGSDVYELFDRRQSAIKVLMNSFYGVTPNDYWRLSMEGLGDSITSSARFSLWQGKEIAESEGFDVAYGDTDSVMVSVADSDETKELAVERGHQLEEVINGRMERCVEASGLHGSHPLLDGSLHGTEKHTLVYEFEKLYRRFFQAGSKKRYAGRIIWKEGKEVNDIDLVGFESQRSDSPELTSDVQPEVIKRILDGEGFDGVSEYLQEVIGGIEDGEIERHRIALPKSLNQPLEEYGNTQTARACRFSNEHLDTDFAMSDDPWLSFVRQTPHGVPKSDVIALSWDEEIPQGYELDVEKTLERVIERPLKPILDEVNWRFTELKNGGQAQSVAETGEWENNGQAARSTADKWNW